MLDQLQDLLRGDKRRDYEDFVDRYETGRPADGISDDEAVRRYDEVATKLPANEYRESARAAFERLTPEERAEFGRFLRERARQNGTPIDALGDDARLQDPDGLADATSRIQQEQPNLLQQVMGPGGMLSNPIAKAALAGVAAMAAQRMFGKR